jgi:antitoxin MazE
MAADQPGRQRNKIASRDLTGSSILCILIVYTWRFGMVTRIMKWGNSLGLRIPKSFAEQAGVREGSPVDIALEGDHLVVRAVISREYRLSDLLSEVREDNIHDETDTGKAAGREVW